MNYTELKTAIADWAHRSDITDSTLDLFIDLAEAEFNNRLRTAEQETVADLVCTSRYTALPADLAEIRVVEHNGTRLRNLEYATPDYMARWRQYEPSGDPKAYSVRGTDLELIPTPDSVTVTLTYWAKVPALSGANPALVALAMGNTGKGKRVRVWVGVFNAAGDVEGTPSLESDCQLDTMQVIDGIEE